MNQSKRIKQQTVDKDGNIVITIRKYNAIPCLFHSLFGLLMIGLLFGGIAILVKGKTIVAIVAFVMCVFLWAAAWLNANDSLKKRVYTTALLGHLKAQNPEMPEPVIARFYSSGDYIECLERDGTVRRYLVEFVMENLPMYVVRIHTRPEEESMTKEDLGKED